MSKLFETAVVGSMPRPLYVQQLLDPQFTSHLSQEQLQTKLDNAIKFIVNLQEQTGIDIISDGEWRRLSYIGVISDVFTGFERTQKEGLWWHTITEPLGYKQKHLFADESQFLLNLTKNKVKVAMPSPFLIGARMWDNDKSTSAYESRESFMKDLAKHLREEIVALSKTGVSVVQIDDPNLCLFVDPDYRKKYDDPQAECQLGVDLVNDMTKGVDGVDIALHLCRSSGTRNRQQNKTRSADFVGEGSYDFILEYLNQLKVDQFAMEFAHPDSGSPQVLEEFPQQAKIGLGCIDVQAGITNSVQEVVKRVELAMEHVDKERIVLNPDCGFAPGNQAPVTIDEAFSKLSTMAQAADQLREKHG